MEIALSTGYVGAEGQLLRFRLLESQAGLASNLQGLVGCKLTFGIF